MTFFDKLDRALARSDSLLCVGLDPNPEFLPQPDRDFRVTDQLLDRLETWLLAVVAETADCACAYKPTLDLYLALGAPGLELLARVVQAAGDRAPVILDAKHGDPITSGVMARTAFETWNADAITVLPFSGQDHVAPFLVYGDRAVFVLAYTDNPSARALQDARRGDGPYYKTLVREVQTWGVPEQVGLEVEIAHTEAVEAIRAIAPDRPLLVRGAWSGSDALQTIDYSRDLPPELDEPLDRALEATLRAGRTQTGDWPIVMVPRAALSHPQPFDHVRRLRDRLNRARESVADASGGDGSACPLWLPGRAIAGDARHPHAELVVQLYDLGCILFGDYVQSSGARFPYYIDLRQIISNPQIFNKILLAYAELLEPLAFDRIAGIPYGSLPTATGLSLQLRRPMIFPRKEVKPHGTQRVVEGSFHPGETAVVVDDILISGNSALQGAAKLESVGLTVRDIVVFIDHGQGVRDRLKAAGYRAHAVLTLSEITETLYSAGCLSETQMAALRDEASASA